ncbi:MAG TPA: hypothetical protein VM598_06580 [Bdellovibrionota bacterium]|nr:hypothetical protein [Bdellovibrionota bacterium]
MPLIPTLRRLSAPLFGMLLLVPATAMGIHPTCKRSLIAHDPALVARYERYLADTLQSLERMRHPVTGLVADRILVTQGERVGVEIENSNTSPSNIALDLLVQLGRLAPEADPAPSLRNLEAALSSIEALPYHRETGLFFSWYSTGPERAVAVRDVSSIDNVHLALALWTLARQATVPGLARRAGILFSRMDFSIYHDPITGLMGGNLRFGDGRWTLEAYRFANLGSEARSIYALVPALGLMRSRMAPGLASRAVTALKAEVAHGILRTWDGGAFQLLLPQVLLNEDRYSERLPLSFERYSRHVIAEGLGAGSPVPAAHSACSFGVDCDPAFSGVPAYHGKAGSPSLVSSGHAELGQPEYRRLWDLVFTPHAAVLAAIGDPVSQGRALGAAEAIVGPGGVPLYVPGLGFMDGLHVGGDYRGRVVPVQLSLDQGMIALALEQILSADGLGPSGRALAGDPRASGRLRRYYALIDQKIAGAESDALKAPAR